MAFRDDRVALRARVEQLEQQLEETRAARAEEISDELRALKQQLAKAEPTSLAEVDVRKQFNHAASGLCAFWFFRCS